MANMICQKRYVNNIREAWIGMRGVGLFHMRALQGDASEEEAPQEEAGIAATTMRY